MDLIQNGEKALLNINGKEVEAPSKKKLINFLREDLKITSVKDGCSEGACGTCSVIVDGKVQKTCVLSCEKFVSKKILTIEGFSEKEKKIYAYAFGKCSAVQCGFCIPGMVICAKSLIDINNNPTKLDAINAIRNNYCRCTGYKKIIDAILLSAKIIRMNLNIDELEKEEKDTTENGLGDDVIRIDAREKALGKGIYCDDIYLEGMLCASALRSKYPRARVIKIDTEEALNSEGVKAIYTWKDVPGENKVGHLKHDWNTFIKEGEITHYIADVICLVVADTWEHVKEAKEKIVVEYEELKGIFSIEDALKEGAEKVHFNEESNVLVEKHLIRGNADEVIKNSKYKITKHYSLPAGEHAFLEPECSVALPLGDGVFIYSTDQSPYDIRRETSIMLGLPEEKVVVENAYVGGGFGGKEDVSVQHLAALAAYKLKLPVKCKLTRQESLNFHPKKHPMEIDMTTACDEKGHLTAMKAVVYADTGAYASLGGPVLERACTHAAGPYNYQIVDILGKAIYTNNPPSGAFRGFGVTQTCFATEMNINELAKMVGIDPFEFRYINAIRKGEVLPNGQIADDSTGLVETLDSIKEEYYKNKYVGIACAMKNAGVGVGIKDVGRVKLIIEKGKVNIYTSASCIGQGSGTVMTQFVCNELGLKLEDVIWHNPNTNTCPDSGTTSGSRQTLITGEACRRACELLKEDLKLDINDNNKKEVYEKLKDKLNSVGRKEYYAEYDDPTDKLGSDKQNPKSHIAYGYATQVCILNEDGSIKKILASHEVGKCVNVKSTEGQIEGGVVMSLGYALTEDLKIKDGVPQCKYGTLGLFRADKVPEIEAIIVEKKGIESAHGAIGIGEITSIPTAPAVASAYEKFLNKTITSLPIQGTIYKK
ncbi:MAG: selenium-dependent xanthine dehydrogenase [Eubacteriales bacterium]|nr:selenium-dependent xanthine dehydrogenase [Eubacteriales bacterium]